MKADLLQELYSAMLKPNEKLGAVAPLIFFSSKLQSYIGKLTID